MRHILVYMLFLREVCKLAISRKRVYPNKIRCILKCYIKGEKAARAENETFVQTRYKLKENSKRVTARDKMARRLGISTATLSKYRRIIKLPEELLDPITR